jgi:hypothetical protein
MKKNKYFQPAFKPAFKTVKPVKNKPTESIVPEEKQYLKDIIQKLDGDLPDNAFEESDYENISSSDKTSVEE